MNLSSYNDEYEKYSDADVRGFPYSSCEIKETLVYNYIYNLNLTMSWDTKEWNELTEHVDKIRGLHLRELLKDE